MYPHERSLVKRMANRPFALIGVNSDRDLNKLKEVMKKQRITWRSFQNSPKGAKKPISNAWGVRGWPTLYLIDHKGVIRKKWLGNPGNETIDAEIEALVKIAEAETKKPGGQKGEGKVAPLPGGDKKGGDKKGN